MTDMQRRHVEPSPLQGRTDRWDPLVRRIMVAAGPELARLRAQATVAGQMDRWTRPLLPLAAALILVFGSILAWAEPGPGAQDPDAPLMAEVLVPEPFSLWLESGASYTLAELAEALPEEGP